jgi:uncharacterized protein
MTAHQSASPWTAVRSAVRRRPAIAFFVAAFALTWAVWIPRALVPQGVLDAPWLVELGATWTYGPAEAALLVAALVGRDALRDLGRRLTRWRVPLRWYAVVLFGPPAFWAVAMAVVGVLGLLGVPHDGDGAPQPPLTDLGVSALPLLGVLVLTDGLGEETGWRGFALPRLLCRLPDFAAGAVLGVVWACWHLPLIWTDGAPLEGGSPVLLFLELPALSILFTWLFRATGGSAFLAILLHGVMNLSFASAAATSARDALLAAVVLVLEWLLAAGVVLSGRLRRRRATRRRAGGAPAAATAATPVVAV